MRRARCRSDRLLPASERTLIELSRPPILDCVQVSIRVAALTTFGRAISHPLEQRSTPSNSWPYVQSHPIKDASLKLILRFARIVVVGGCESSRCPLGFLGKVPAFYKSWQNIFGSPRLRPSSIFGNWLD